MKQKLSDIYDALQELDIKPTPNNTKILCGVFSVLQEVYKELDEKEGAENDGRTDCTK